MEWCAFVLKTKTKPGNLFTDNGNLFTIRLARSGITRPAAQGKYSPHVGESGFRTRGNFCLWTDSGIQEICCGIWNPWALDSGIHIKPDWNPDCSTWNPESTIWNPKYKTVLDSMGRKCQGCPASREWIHQTRTFWNWNWSSETFGRR